MQLFLVLKNRQLNFKITEIILVQLQIGIISQSQRVSILLHFIFQKLEVTESHERKKCTLVVCTSSGAQILTTPFAMHSSLEVALQVKHRTEKTKFLV